MIDESIIFIKDLYPINDNFIPLHEANLSFKEKSYLTEALESNNLSTRGYFIERLEQSVQQYTKSNYVIGVNSGTSALHLALLACGVTSSEYVLLPSLTFVATSNAIAYTGANQIFLDIEKKSYGLDPDELIKFLETNCQKTIDHTVKKGTKNRIGACVPVHTLGIPCQIERIKEICAYYKIPIVEDAAESLGSHVNGKHTGTYGEFAAISLNGNKIITSGAGGLILCKSKNDQELIRHLSLTSKIPHPWEYEHDRIGFNYKMPNLNAAVGLAQFERLDEFLRIKRKIAETYHLFFSKFNEIMMIEGNNWNNWLNALVLKDKNERNRFLNALHQEKIDARPLWKLMSKLNIHGGETFGDLPNSTWLQDSVVTLPSGINGCRIK